MSQFKIFWIMCCLYLFTAAAGSITLAQNSHDMVNGNLIQFNDNGLWCWYQDERVIVDTVNGKIILGTDASDDGIGGSARNGAVESVIFDLKNRLGNRYQLSQFSCDDHNSPGLIIRPDGKYIALYSEHYDQYKNRYRIFDGSVWSPEKAYDWTTRIGGTDYTIAYNNVYYLSAESKMYDFSRANRRAPNFLVSNDMGNSWTWGGQLTTNTSNSYNKGYYKYWGNGIDRIDFIFTEQHPRDTSTSIYHGYIKGGKAYRSDGSVADENIFDTTFIPAFWNFTKVFSEGTVMGGLTMRRCWQADLMKYENGTIATIITTRSNDNTLGNDAAINPDHNFIYCRYDGIKWNATYLGKAGPKLYSSEADYTGLATLSPNNANVLYITTTFDPRDTTVNLGVREIFKGVSQDSGKSWTWTPITQKSVRDNLRPIVPLWNKENEALLWCRGTYNSAQGFDAAVVGLITKSSDKSGKKYYVDASLSNTNLASGSALLTTGPDSAAGVMDSKWHQRLGYGNGGSLFASAELAAGENAPLLKTSFTVPDVGSYDVWANFWGNPVVSSNWRISAGLSSTSLQVYRSMACQQVDSSEYTKPLMVSGNGNFFLYQAYLGRVTVASSKSVDIFVDDSAYRINTAVPTLQGDFNRTWYDGITFAGVNSTSLHVASVNSIPDKFSLNQNYPNPFNPSTIIQYATPFRDNVELRIFNMLGQEVTVLINKEMPAGIHPVTWNASQYSSGMYFYRITIGGFSEVKRMMFVK